MRALGVRVVALVDHGLPALVAGGERVPGGGRRAERVAATERPSPDRAGGGPDRGHVARVDRVAARSGGAELVERRRHGVEAVADVRVGLVEA